MISFNFGRRRTMRQSKTSFVAAALAGVSLATISLTLTPRPIAAQTLAEAISPLMIVETKGRGPGEKIVRFLPAPNAEDYSFPDAEIVALSTALTEKNRAAARAARIALGIKAFGSTQGAFGAMGTLGEHAAYMKSFSRVNNALNNIGLVLALAQVSRDVANGNTAEALYGSIKAMVNYGIGRFGSSALQIAGVATFVVDVTLSEWQAGLTDIGVGVWACRYKAYYDAHGMTVSDWKIKALELYEFATKDGNASWFNIYLDGAVNEYVHRAFPSGALELYSECNGSSFGDTESIKRTIEEAYKGILEQMLAKKVLPEISDRIWRDYLRQQVANANAELKPQLNQTYLLEVTAYNAPEGARIVIPLPNGGKWGGPLRADGTLKGKLTYYALMKAGFPMEARYESAEGSQTQELVIADGRMTTVFGVPNTPLVVRYKIEEGAQSCTLDRIEAGQPTTVSTQTRPARAETFIDMATVMDGTVSSTMFMGKFDVETQGWAPASPGRITTKAMVFGSPYHDGIQSMENCSFDLLTNANLVQGECTIERLERKAVSSSVTIERICISPASMELVGIFTSLSGGDAQYYAMDTPAGKAAIKFLQDAMRYATEGGYPTSP